MNDAATLEKSADTRRAASESPPKPDAALKRLERLVGTWQLKGHPIGSDDYSITGRTTFKWLHEGSVDGETGFFLQQDMDMDYAGKRITAHELIGYDPETKAFSSFVYSNMAPDPWPYRWDMQGDEWTISIKHGPMDAEFNGKLSPDGNSFSGGWRPRPGADEKINSAYDVEGTRIA
jgi:hypothetical protein